jgi:S1-C subfamily serine protease
MKTYTIGRNPSADIILTANFCSRDHAKLTVSDNGKILLQDASSNGTNAKGKKITNQTIEVNYGDEILFAGVEKLDWSKIEKPETKPNEPSEPSPVIAFIKRHALKTTIALTVIGLLLLLFRFITSINTTKVEQPLTATEIYSRYKNAVALVEVKYYVRIESVAGDRYFGIKGDSTMGLAKTKAELKPLTSEGTAFFIDSTGKLITNHHVVEPWLYDRDLKDYFFTKIKPAIKRALRENGWGEDDPKFYGGLEAIYIYPNGKTFSTENRIECSVYKQSEDKDIDLASLQILNVSLPPNASIISSANTQTDETKLQVGAPAYVIGFPYGDALALNEDNELNCTSTQGSFTQAPSKSYVQYSAQTASGGSGSPVFDQYGNLVAVTYQGSTNGQSFNRGILAKHIHAVR